MPVSSRVNTIARLERLPGTAPVLAALIARLDRPEPPSADELADIIEKDPSLSAGILRLANTPAYRGAEPVDDLEEAVVRVGHREIHQTAVGAAAAQAVGGVLDGFWQHAVAVAVIARTIGDERAYLAGLLHDLGKIILYDRRPKLFRRLVDEARRVNRPFHAVERQELGIDHAELGAMLARKWELPDWLMRAIGEHHRIEMLTSLPSPDERTTVTVCLADAAAKRSMIGVAGDEHRHRTVEALTEWLGVDDASLTDRAVESREAVFDAMARFRAATATATPIDPPDPKPSAILIWSDEGVPLSVETRILERLGHTVTRTGGPPESGRFDAVLFNMPNHLDRVPAIRTARCTAIVPHEAEPALPDGVAALRHPFSPSELVGSLVL